MDAIVKYGDFFYTTNDSGIWGSLLVTLIGAFVGFFLALLANRGIERRAKKKKRLEVKKSKLTVLKYLHSVIESITEFVPKQTARYNEFSDTLKKAPLEVAQPKILATFDLLRLRNADNVDTQSAYLEFFPNEDAYKDYKNLFASGDYLFRELESIELQVANATKFKHKDQLVVRDLLEKIAFLLGCRMQDIQGAIGMSKAQKDPEWIFLSQTATAYYNIIQTVLNFDQLHKTFIIPVMQFTPQIKDRVIGREVTEHVVRANSRIINIGENAKIFADDIGSTEERFSKPLSNLNTLKEALKKLIEQQTKIHIESKR